MDKEVHPLALQNAKTKVTFSDFVHMKEFSEQHPSAFFKIRPSLVHLEGSNESLAESNSSSCSVLDYRRNHSIIYLPSSDSSTLSTEEGIETWKEDENSDDDQSDTEEQEAAVCEDDTCPEDDEQCADDEIHVLKDEEAAASTASKAQSFKIKWSFKRKKKKRLRLKVPQRSRKFLFLGDMNCGKSNLITTYCKDRFFEQYQPTILHFCQSDVKVMKRTLDVILADTSGRNDFKPLRQCAYFKTDIAILCYSAENRNTLERIRTYWLPELKECAPKCPFVIVETKKDLREELEDKKTMLESEGKTESLEYQRISKELAEKIVPEGMGARVARELGAEGFYSTSARYRVGTRKMIQNITVIAVKKSRRKRQIP